MARSTIVAAAGSDSASLTATQELVAPFEAALAVLVADGAAPTQAHVTTANNAYTLVKAVWTNAFVMDYDRATLTNENLIRQAMNAAFNEARKIK